MRRTGRARRTSAVFPASRNIEASQEESPLPHIPVGLKEPKYEEEEEVE